MFFVQLIRWLETSMPVPALLRDRRAVTSIEYVIIAVIIAIAVVGGLSKAGGYIGNDFNNASSEL
jgi:Flp pilus assembly pilin Flp